MTNTLNPYQLANMADTYTPDSIDSPGAKFLLNVQDVVEDYIWYATDDGQGIEDLRDSIQEIADSSVPVYTYEIWQVFTDLGAYMEEVTDFGPIEDMTQAASIALYMIAERLAAELIEERIDDA